MRLPEGVTVQGEKFYSFPKMNKKIGIIDFEEANGTIITLIGICYGNRREIDINYIYHNGVEFKEE